MLAADSCLGARRTRDRRPFVGYVPAMRGWFCLAVLGGIAAGCGPDTGPRDVLPPYDPPPAPPAVAILYGDGMIAVARSSARVLTPTRDTMIAGRQFSCRQDTPVAGQYHPPLYLGSLVASRVTLDVRDPAGGQLGTVSVDIDHPAWDTTGWLDVQVAAADPFPSSVGAEVRSFPLLSGLAGSKDSLWVRISRRATEPLFSGCR